MKHREENCCFTGHRPEKLPWGERESDPRCLALKARLQAELATLYDKGYRHFICGMARGTDLYFGEAVLALRAEHPEITLEAAIPYPTQANFWPAGEKVRYAALLDACDYETMVQHHYTPSCLQRRNRYMVDHAALVLSVFDGQSGGTMNTLTYAIEQGLELVIIDL